MIDVPRYDGSVASVLRFLESLEQGSIDYQLSTARPEALMVSVAVPGQRWEIEFLASGAVEVEVFAGDGQIYEHDKLADLLEHFAE
jgi:hypothetical protein